MLLWPWQRKFRTRKTLTFSSIFFFSSLDLLEICFRSSLNCNSLFSSAAVFLSNSSRWEVDLSDTWGCSDVPSYCGCLQKERKSYKWTRTYHCILQQQSRKQSCFFFFFSTVRKGGVWFSNIKICANSMYSRNLLEKRKKAGHFHSQQMKINVVGLFLPQIYGRGMTSPPNLPPPKTKSKEKMFHCHYTTILSPKKKATA